MQLREIHALRAYLQAGPLSLWERARVRAECGRAAAGPRFCRAALTPGPSPKGRGGRFSRHALRMAGLVAVAVLCNVFAWHDIAHAARHTAWATGMALQQKLAQPVDIFWSNTPLRGALQGLAETQKVAILIDRRVDPGRKLDLTIKGEPMRAALQTIAERCGLGLSRLSAVVYLGPPPTAEQLRPVANALRQSVRQLPPAAKRKFFHFRAIAWSDLSTPRDLLTQLARRNGLEIVGLDRVPHDLWAAADLPPLSLVDRLTLIAIQFDLTFKVTAGGTKLELVPVPENLQLSAGDGQPFSAWAPSTTPTTREHRTNLETLRIKRMFVQAEPLEPVLRQLAKRLGLELRIDEEAIRDADIIAPATIISVRDSYIQADWIKAGALCANVSDNDYTFEAVKKADKIVYDGHKQFGIPVTLGEMVKTGLLDPERDATPMGDVVIGKAPGREHDAEIIFFSALGMGVYDLMVANEVYKKAKEMGIGTPLKLWDDPYWT